jgi:hypothetical protein
MISSEGKGMQADSIAMRRAIPPYPVAAITDFMKRNRTARILSVMRSVEKNIRREARTYASRTAFRTETRTSLLE